MLDECKEFFLSISWIDENNASLGEIEDEFMQGLICKCICCIDYNNSSLAEIEAVFKKRILDKYMLKW